MMPPAGSLTRWPEVACRRLRVWCSYFLLRDPARSSEELVESPGRQREPGLVMTTMHGTGQSDQSPPGERDRAAMELLS
jgi:hypothetical protein